MFTGIVRECVEIFDRREGNILSFDFLLPRKASVFLGESVLINGICSTVSRISPKIFSVDYMPETQRKTTVNDWKKGDILHFEPSLKAGESIGGHFVFGHIDAALSVSSVRSEKNEYTIGLSLPGEWKQFVVLKGSVALDGVSLTVSFVSPEEFFVSLIPHTLEHTHLGDLRKGDRVNVEFDILAKYAQNAKETF